MKLINDDSVEVPIESSVKASNHLSALITITPKKMFKLSLVKIYNTLQTFLMDDLDMG